jgi:hypothetical protein
MPIGPPFQMPAPKSAWNPLLAPIVFSIVLELERTGSVSTGVFQMLFGGRTEHVPIVCWAWALPASAKPSMRPTRDTRVIERS